MREPPITRWKHTRQGPRFDAVLDVNRDPSGPAVRPARVTLAAVEARRRGVTPGQVEPMREIERYNEIDWRVMAEVIGAAGAKAGGPFSPGPRPDWHTQS